MYKRKQVRKDAKLMNLSEEELDVMWRFRHPEEGGTVLGYEEILVEIPLRYGFTVSSLDTLSRFYVWLEDKRRWEEAAERAEEAKLRRAKEDPQSSLEELEAYGQIVFTSEVIKNKDPLNFARLRKLRLQEKAVENDSRRIALLEAKEARLDYAEAKAKELKAGGGLSAETLEVIEKQLKLL